MTIKSQQLIEQTEYQNTVRSHNAIIVRTVSSKLMLTEHQLRAQQ